MQRSPLGFRGGDLSPYRSTGKRPDYLNRLERVACDVHERQWEVTRGSSVSKLNDAPGFETHIDSIDVQLDLRLVVDNRGVGLI